MSEKAAQSGTKASIKKAKVSRWTQLARGLGQVGLGLAGGFIAGDIADYYNEVEKKMEVDILNKLREEINEDKKQSGKVISYEI